MFNFLKKIVSPLARIKSALSQKIRALFSKAPDDAAFDHLEQIFYEADLGHAIAAELVAKVKVFYKKNPTVETEQILDFVKQELLQTLAQPQTAVPLQKNSPHVILFVGVNGSGKTTSLAKLASYYQKAGKKVLIAAGDTFRAAAVEQLEAWAKRIGADLIKSQHKGDPAGVAFDALAAAKARGVDIVLIDTAGRLQTKSDLMEELAKVRRVCQKQIPESPHETLLVVDATIGQNALDQAQTFNKFTPITGIVLSKLDGSAKGGIAVPIQKNLKIPIRWIGTGEGAEDLAPFDPKEYVEALFSAD